MKMVEVKEWADLTPAQKEAAKARETESYVGFRLDCLSQDLDSGMITEEEYYSELGCSKSYAESTAWFVPACFYEKHKEEVDAEVLSLLKDGEYSKSGRMLYLL